jgi:hypothetical protein
MCLILQRNAAINNLVGWISIPAGDGRYGNLLYKNADILVIRILCVIES